MITPSDVAERMIATRSGVSTRPLALSSESHHHREHEGERPAKEGQPEQAAAQFAEVDLEPARKSRTASPMSASTSIVWSISTQPSTDGPITMPATISNTTDGSRTRGNSPSRNGARSRPSRRSAGR